MLVLVCFAVLMRFCGLLKKSLWQACFRQPDHIFNQHDPGFAEWPWFLLALVFHPFGWIYSFVRFFFCITRPAGMRKGGALTRARGPEKIRPWEEFMLQVLVCELLLALCLWFVFWWRLRKCFREISPKAPKPSFDEIASFNSKFDIDHCFRSRDVSSAQAFTFTTPEDDHLFAPKRSESVMFTWGHCKAEQQEASEVQWSVSLHVAVGRKENPYRDHKLWSIFFSRTGCFVYPVLLTHSHITMLSPLVLSGDVFCLFTHGTLAAGGFQRVQARFSSTNEAVYDVSCVSWVLGEGYEIYYIVCEFMWVCLRSQPKGDVDSLMGSIVWDLPVCAICLVTCMFFWLRGDLSETA